MFFIRFNIRKYHNILFNDNETLINKFIEYDCKIIGIKKNSITYDDLINYDKKTPLLHEFRMVYENFFNIDERLFNDLYNELLICLKKNKKNLIILELLPLQHATNYILRLIINRLKKYSFDKKITISRQSFLMALIADYNQLCVNISIYNKKKIIIGEEKNVLKLFLFYLEVINEKKLIKIFCKYSDNKSWKFLQFPISYGLTMNLREHNVLLAQPTIKKYYIYTIIGGLHFSNNYPIISSNQWYYNNNSTVITEEYENTLQNYNSTELYIDFVMIPEIKKIFNINNLSKIISEMKKFVYFPPYSNKKLNELYKKSNIKSFRQFLKLHLYEKKTLLVWNEYKKYKKYQMEYTNAQKRFSLNLQKLLFSSFTFYFKNYHGPIFFIAFSDFRGRNYHKSMVSLYSSKIFRFLFHYGIYDNHQIKNLNLQILLNVKITIAHKYQQHLYWIYLSIGIVLKKKLPYKAQYTYDELIVLGKNYENYMDSIDAASKIEIIYYLQIITDLNNDQIIFKRYLSKDSTASIFQHLGKLLEFRVNDNLKFLNFTIPNVWFDTYSVFLNKLQYNCKHLKLNQLIKRQYLKKIIMTYYYSATFFTIKDYFYKIIIKDLGDEYWHNNENNLNILIYNIWQQLSEIELEFYNYSIKDFKKQIKNNSDKNEYIFILDDITINLTYYKSKKKRFDWQQNNKRQTIIWQVPVYEINNYKTELAIIPNLVHALDAKYMRQVLNSHKGTCIVIHDAFLIDFANTENIILAAQQNINLKINYQFTHWKKNPNNNKSITISSNSIII